MVFDEGGMHAIACINIVAGVRRVRSHWLHLFMVCTQEHLSKV
ncbi:hypothetical protein [Calothrix sp. PCC 7507]|nr:hypothetical protein [Calothrix sp. PCC 7507]